VEIAAGALSSETFVGLPGAGRGIALADAPVVARSVALLGSGVAADDLPAPDLSSELPAEPGPVMAEVPAADDRESEAYVQAADEPVEETPAPAPTGEVPERVEASVETPQADHARPAPSCAGLAWVVLALGVSLGFGLGVAVVRWAGV
jgi:hypothetical protein